MVVLLCLLLLLVVVLVLHVRMGWLGNSHIKLVPTDHAAVGWGDSTGDSIFRDLVELRG